MKKIVTIFAVMATSFTAFAQTDQEIITKLSGASAECTTLNLHISEDPSANVLKILDIKKDAVSQYFNAFASQTEQNGATKQQIRILAKKTYDDCSKLENPFSDLE